MMPANRLLILCLILSLCVSGGRSLQAQDVFVRNIAEDNIIIPIGRRSWEGTPKELRRINRVSVPASYKQRCAPQPEVYDDGSRYPAGSSWSCYIDLLSWHFNYGSPRSAQKALRYIAERKAREHKLTPGAGARYSELLQKGLTEAEAYLAAEGLTYEKFLEENRIIDAARYPTLAELRDLSGVLSETSFVVDWYIEAADWYRSPSLLSEATQWYSYLPPVQAPVREEELSDPERLLARIAYYRQGDFLALRLAIAKAATERSEASVLAAHELSARVFAAASLEQDFRYRKGSKYDQFKYLRFRIQLLAYLHDMELTKHEGVYLGSYEFRHLEDVLRDEDRDPNSMRYPGRGEARQFIEAIVAHGEIAVEAAPSCTNDDYDFNEELGILFNGGRVVSQAHSPAPYRRIAQLYVDLFDTLEKCQDKDDETFRFVREAPFHNQARHYQNFLDNYDEIALGR